MTFHTRTRLLSIVAVAVFALGAVAACSSDDSSGNTSDGGSSSTDAPSGGSANDEGAPVVADPTATATELANEYFRILADADAEALDAFLSPAYQLQRADGSTSTKEEYLRNPATVHSFEITNVRGTVDGHVLVALYDVSTNEEIDGEVYEGTPAPRVSAFVWSDGAWRLAAHSNFNVPAGG